MRIYGVVLKVGGPTHVVIAKNPTDAMVGTANYLNQYFQTDHLYEAPDFDFIDITDMVPRPVVIS